LCVSFYKGLYCHDTAKFSQPSHTFRLSNRSSKCHNGESEDGKSLVLHGD
jgi:hypothetical protein